MKSKKLLDKIEKKMPETYKFIDIITTCDDLTEKAGALLYCEKCQKGHPFTSASVYFLSFSLEYLEPIIKNADIMFEKVNIDMLRFEILSAPYFCFPYVKCFIDYCKCSPDESIYGFPKKLSGWERKWKKDREKLKSRIKENPSAFPKYMLELSLLPEDYFEKREGDKL